MKYCPEISPQRMDEGAEALDLVGGFIDHQSRGRHR